MNDMIIGMENLPNIFIDNIRVEQDSLLRSTIKLRIGAFDTIENPRWYRNEMLTAGLKFKVVLETNGEKITELNDGLLSLYDYEIGQNVKVFSAASLQRFYVPSIEATNYRFYYMEVNFDSQVYGSILNVYTSFFVDNLNFENDLFNKFYGPLAGEIIYSGGALNNTTNYFYDPVTNLEYGGPVHVSPTGQFMAGSKHSDSSHSNLVKVEEENFKIVYEALIEEEGPPTTTGAAPGGVPTPPGNAGEDEEVTVEDPNVGENSNIQGIY